MKRIVRLTVSLWLPLALAACAPALTPAAAPTAMPTTAPLPTVQPATLPPAAQPGGLFFARPQGEAGPLLAYDMASGTLRFSLPAGLLSADGQHFLAVKTGADTQLLWYDLTTGAEHAVSQLTGQWELSSVSATGRWAALTRLVNDSEKQTWTAETWKTEVQVVDAASGQAGPPIELAGNFTVDTLSPAGASLFVIQYLPAIKPDHYQVRLYDLSTHTLQDGALVDKREPDEEMAGQRWQAVAPASGSWLYTLYLRPSENSAFVHALDTENKYTLCFDLPEVKGSTLEQLKDYSLALSPDGQTLYAANPALGVIARVDLSASDVSNVASFTPGQAAAADASAPINYSVADARRLYFTGGNQIWAFDTATRQVTSLSTLATAINGLGLAPDGRQLFVARPNQAPVIFDTASGAAFSSQ